VSTSSTSCDVEVHALDARGDQRPLGGELSAYELAEVGAELEAARIVEGEGRPLLDLDGRGTRRRDVGAEVEAREEIIQVEGADGDLHKALP
jgi:hypothetical protein